MKVSVAGAAIYLKSVCLKLPEVGTEKVTTVDDEIERIPGMQH